MQRLIKTCGMKTPETLLAALNGGADMIGFIFFAKSPRNLSIAEALELSKVVHNHGARLVAVTVDADDDFLDAIVKKVEPDLLQLHGGETPERLGVLKARYGLPLIKAVSIREKADLDKVKPYEGVADWFLFDAKPPKGSDLPGGNGVTFDWELLAGFRSPTPWLLSGGLTCDNVEGAMTFGSAAGIDVSSGLETAPGEKSVDLIAEFLAKSGRDKKALVAASGSLS